MDDPKTANNHLHLSRRGFLRVTTASIVGAIFAGASTNDVCAATENQEILLNSSKDQSENYLFKDSLRREVPLPKKIERVVPSGILHKQSSAHYVLKR